MKTILAQDLLEFAKELQDNSQTDCLDPDMPREYVEKLETKEAAIKEVGSLLEDFITRLINE